MASRMSIRASSYASKRFGAAPPTEIARPDVPAQVRLRDRLNYITKARQTVLRAFGRI